MKWNRCIHPGNAIRAGLVYAIVTVIAVYGNVRRAVMPRVAHQVTIENVLHPLFIGRSCIGDLPDEPVIGQIRLPAI